MNPSRDRYIGLAALGFGMKLLVGAIAFALLLGMAKKPPEVPPAPKHAAPIAHVATDAVASLLKQYLANPHAAPLNAYVVDLGTLRRFYEARNYAPAWSNRAQAQAALAILAQSGDDGLDSVDYHADALTARNQLNSAAALAEYDLLLSDGLLHYARDMRKGRLSPDEVEHDVELPDSNFDSVTALNSALNSNAPGKFISDLSPPHPEYAALKKAYIHYRDIAARGGWAEIPADFAFAAGDDSPILRTRLAYEESDIGDDLQAALKRYQSRNNLEPTGKLDEQTLAALNVPASERAGQIAANMERWRWVPAFDSRYIEVNTADTTLEVVENGKVTLSSRIIAGKRASPTPIFFAHVTAVTINPPWNIPHPIARNEMLPKLRRNPGYLSSQHIVLVNGPAGDPYGQTINWHAVSAANFPYALRQMPGDDNALGYVKLEMPNKFDTYLHDTSSRSLFARDDRHLSHGCMRVQQIQPLASYALTGDVNAGLTQIKSAIDLHATQHFPLDRTLPVYVLYWTAIADADGITGFRSDVYGRDAKLLAVLAGKRPVGRVSMIGTECSAG